VYKKGSKSYTHHSFVTEVLSVIAGQMMDEIKALLAAAPKVGFMIDESVDVSGKEQLIYYWRLLDERGTPFNIFGGLMEVDKADADNITNVIIDILHAHDVTHYKVAGFASDGASVMTGVHNGVAAQLKERVNPLMITVHCICHRLALACGDASKSVTYLTTVFEPLLNDLFYFYEFSPKRKGSLLDLQHLLQSDSIKLIQSGHTRWLSIETVVRAVRVGYVAMLDDLQRHAAIPSKYSSTAKGLRMRMSTLKFVSTLFLMCDVLPHVASLSKMFQRESVAWYQTAAAVESTQDVLLAYKVSDGMYTSALADELQLKKAHDSSSSDAEEDDCEGMFLVCA
jgi:hypothetical protein